MDTKLILVEGLPGFGKSMTAKLIYDSLMERNIDAELYLEGDLHHPADYDGVACFTREQYEDLLLHSRGLKEAIKDFIQVKDRHYFLPYEIMKLRLNRQFPDPLMSKVFEHDIYELPFERNKELIANKWEEFVQEYSFGNKIVIFECCFIQNPVTIGMVKYNKPKENVLAYVLKLANIIEKLNPVLIYVEQDDLEFSFEKAVQERPKAWSDGFVEYYTNQGFGKEQKYIGKGGALAVLKERQKIEAEIYDRLSMTKFKVNNSNYELQRYQKLLNKRLSSL
ncbi:hypothetical protein KGF86_10060 [Ornithinibacillus massiliensis]|uniref:Adenylyl-sulfate kinase n=1 Tax=Ornithinibacillus massiliensis TaxID=1944633 RepID=A0ABS5ME04_9BACI|nr:hypothetical protein [Ornithinibacillus massiliensis]MBS3680560.1 hypothetical protein [Ornithinibacillus massiliensis]